MCSRDTTRDSGAAAVEFALISLILFTLLFGIMNYGFYFLQATSAEAAAREGARRAAVGIDSCSDWQDEVRNAAPAVEDSFTSIALDNASDRGDDITVTIAWTPTDFGLIPLPGAGSEVAVTRLERAGTVTADCS